MLEKEHVRVDVPTGPPIWATWRRCFRGTVQLDIVVILMVFPTHVVAVGGIVEDGRGNILLVRSHVRGWEYPGGQVEVGENLIDALSREIREESGVNANIEKLIGVYSNTRTRTLNDGTFVPTLIIFDFICRYLGGDISTSDETAEVRWVPREDVLIMINHPAFVARYNCYLNFDGKTNYIEYTTGENFVEHLIRFL